MIAIRQATLVDVKRFFKGFLEEQLIIYTLFIPLEDRIGRVEIVKTWDESYVFFRLSKYMLLEKLNHI